MTENKINEDLKDEEAKKEIAILEQEICIAICNFMQKNRYPQAIGMCVGVLEFQKSNLIIFGQQIGKPIEFDRIMDEKKKGIRS
jgi:hypothetical protein